MTKTAAGLAGLRRESRTGGHLARDLARSNEETKTRRMVWSVGRRGDRNCVGDEWRQRWGSGPRRDRRCSACFGERRSWARSTALQELVGATSSSGGARWRALRRQWRTAELVRPWRRCYAQQNEGKAGGGHAVLTVRAQGGPVSERERRGRSNQRRRRPTTRGGGRRGSDASVPPIPR